MFINKKSENKKLKNSILALSAEAVAAKKKDRSVINATTGMLKNEDGSLYEFDCVNKAVQSLSSYQKYGYCNTAGTPSFKQAVYRSLFGNFLETILDNSFLECIPTPGGTGALSLSFSHYVEPDETILLPNHMWENYLSMAAEAGINSDTYQLFDENDNFDIANVNEKVNSLKEKQKRLTILINDPCENPTGFCMKDEDYDHLIDIARNNPNNDFVFIVDVAYFDFYNTNPDIIRSRFAKFKNIPNNAIALFIFSGSKSFGLYGLRIGALVILSKDTKEVETFASAMNYSSRSLWSSSSTLGLNIIDKLISNEEYRVDYEEEVKFVCAMLEKRSYAFLNASKEVGLKTLPYKKGFFICVPCLNPEKIMNALHQDKVYLVCTKSCLRIALCAISKEEAAILPAIIKNRMALEGE